ncbi:27018_t:CDS:2 [Gigaspora margarita]|uniref:27018_t:CDS:1 n=1 Tax=Gigaspora margarita TaxID=4874 RepID=A0ABN7WX09_GIGMA|nr:27018_t:CDS:2 [Gigaspora margarita]
MSAIQKEKNTTMKTDTRPDMVTDSEQINVDYQQSLLQKRIKTACQSPLSITSPTEHNTTGNPTQRTGHEHMRFLPNNPYIEQQQHAIHPTSSPEIETQHGKDQ